MRAANVLLEAADTIAQRGKDYDTRNTGRGERSMARAVAIFNAATGQNLSEHDGWMFMVALKTARIYANPKKLDSYVDGAAYFGLAAESVILDDETPPS